MRLPITCPSKTHLPPDYVYQFFSVFNYFSITINPCHFHTHRKIVFQLTKLRRTFPIP